MAIRSKRINSRAKGCRGERMFRDILRAEGYLKARRGQQFCGSPDSPDVICEELPEIAFEVKFCENTSADKWLDKAENDHPGKIVIIAHKQKHSPWKYYCRRIMEIIRRSDFPKVFANARVETPPKNQCMGCQAGWPLLGDNHKVVGGYPGELVGCMASKYK